MTQEKLIISMTSPYARKARITALENGVPFEQVVDVPWNEDTDVIKVNPLGKVPVWITEDGSALFDSRVIVEYLELKSGQRFSGSTPKQKIEILQLEALADGIMDASLCIFAERKKRPAELQHDWWIQRQFSKIKRGLAQFERILQDKTFVFENQLSRADFALVSALGYVGLRFSEDFNWKTEYPALARYYNFMMQRPSVASTVPVV